MTMVCPDGDMSGGQMKYTGQLDSHQWKVENEIMGVEKTYNVKNGLEGKREDPQNGKFGKKKDSGILETQCS